VNAIEGCCKKKAKDAKIADEKSGIPSKSPKTKNFSQGITKLILCKLTNSFIEVERLKMIGPCSYDVKNNPDYAPIARALELSLAAKKEERNLAKIIEGTHYYCKLMLIYAFK